MRSLQHELGRQNVASDGQKHRPRRRFPSRSRAQVRRSPPRAHSRWLTQPPTSVTAAVLGERARIARELHDRVAQALYAITLTASRAQALLAHQDGDQLY